MVQEVVLRARQFQFLAHALDVHLHLGLLPARQGSVGRGKFIGLGDLKFFTGIFKIDFRDPHFGHGHGQLIGSGRLLGQQEVLKSRLPLLVGGALDLPVGVLDAPRGRGGRRRRLVEVLQAHVGGLALQLRTLHLLLELLQILGAGLARFLILAGQGLPQRGGGVLDFEIGRGGVEFRQRVALLDALACLDPHGLEAARERETQLHLFHHALHFSRAAGRAADVPQLDRGHTMQRIRREEAHVK